MNKNIFSTLILVTAVAFFFQSCKKEETQVVFLGGTAPVLTASTDTLPFIVADTSQPLVTFSWTNPNYQFSNGVSSQNVTYVLEIDTLGANFTSTFMQSVIPTPTYSLDTTFTVAQLNAIIGNGVLQGSGLGQSHHIQIRVVSYLQAPGNATQLVSNVLNYTVIPFAPPPKITPPSTGTLFIVGSATPGGAATGWDNPIDAGNVAGQTFTQVSPTEYKITIPLIGGGEYKFIGQDGSWNEQWSVATADDPTELYGGPFISNGNNTLAPATSGTYLIDVNFQTGLFTVTLQ